MKRILAGFIMDGRSGGIDKYLLNFLEETRKNDVQIDFLTNEIDKKLEGQLEQYHSRLYAIADLKHPISQYRTVRSILKETEYDIAYFNISTAIDCVAAIAAKHAHVKRILLHSHSSGNDCESVLKRKMFNGIHYFCRLFLYRYATEYYGCSNKAGEWMFPKRIVRSDRFQVIYNAVDRKQFEFCEQERDRIRKELGIEGQFVVGHAGNFCYQKNHLFLIDIFREIKNREPKACLLLVGDGVRFEAVKKKVKENGLEDAVLFMGRCGNIASLYQAMDVFVLPSNFEGLPIVGIEAQSAGLPCIMSDTITKESRITEACEFLPLTASPEEWAEKIVKERASRKEARYLECAKNYDLKTQKEQLLELVNRTGDDKTKWQQ